MAAVLQPASQPEASCPFLMLLCSSSQASTITVLSSGADLASGCATRSLGKERTEMEPSQFDELTKALATSTSRRQALRRIGGFLGGTALAGLFPGLALASNSACAKFCNAVFGADTPAAMQCISDAAHHKGLCYICGPASLGGTQPICCSENGSGQCTSYSSATCCTSGQTCAGGTCCPTGQACNGTCCPSGQSCSDIGCCPNCQNFEGRCQPCNLNGCPCFAGGVFCCTATCTSGICSPG